MRSIAIQNDELDAFFPLAVKRMYLVPALLNVTVPAGTST